MTGIDENKCVYLRDLNGDGDIDLIQYCRRECKKKCDIEFDANLEYFAENMGCDCPVSYLYHMAVGHAELRHRLGQYESSGLDPEELRKKTCEWSEDKEGNWSCSKCDIIWAFWCHTDTGPMEKDTNFCPKCGRKIVNIHSFNHEERD
jgi:hypothetical protein